MKLRRLLIVMVLIGSLVATSATPARAAYPDVDRWKFAVLTTTVILVAFWISAGYTPAERSQGAEDDPLLKACTERRPVKLQYKTNSGWDTIASGKTNDKGKFDSEEKNRGGKYRVKFPAYTADGGYECYAGVSEPKTYRK